MARIILPLLLAAFFLGEIYGTSVPKVTPPPPEPTTCPSEESLAGLDMNKMIGFWHIVETTTTIPVAIRSPNIKPIECQKFEVSQSDDKRHHLKHLFLYKNTRQYSKDYTIVPENTAPHNSSETHEIKFTVLATDYDKYAIVFTCEQNFQYYRVAQILSRTSSLDAATLEEIHAKLASNKFDTNDLEPVAQDNCVESRR